MKIEEKYLETKFGKIDYLEIGSGSNVLVYFHGWTGTPSVAIKIAHLLENKNFKIIAPYLPGHGDSFDLNDSFTFKNLVETFEDFFAKLDLKDTMAIGHSVGGVTVYELANSGKNLIKKAVIIDGYNNFRHDGLIQLLPLLYATIREKGLLRHILKTNFARIRSRIKLKKVKTSALAISDTFIKTLNPSKVNLKVLPMKNYLFIWGRKDVITPESEWIKQTAVDSSRVVEFVGGHCWCTMHFSRTWPTIKNFLLDN